MKISSRLRHRLIRALASFLSVAILLLSPAYGAPPPVHSATGSHAMVVAESAPAAHAGVEILKQGGNAVDAACATALAVGVTNPASCGIGGGGFMLIYIAKTHKVYALDYRERAPLKASADMYLRDGRAQGQLSRDGPLAVAVPGEIAGIDAALRRLGTMKFQEVAAPAIRLARDGFPLSLHLAREIAWLSPKLKKNPAMRAVYLKPDGASPQAGDTLREPNLAATLKRLGDDPAREFYHGGVARELVAFLNKQGGLLSAEDLASYSPVWRDPLHRPYHGHEIYVMPPPSSGGIVLEMLGMLEPTKPAKRALNSPPYLLRLIEVMRQGFVDRARYGDPAFVKVPIRMLLSAPHIAKVRRRAFDRVSPKLTPQAHDHGTSNLCVIDPQGNVVVITTTINTIFGSKVMVPKLGIILNNEMDDFGIAPGVPNAYRLAGTKPNAIAPGKRPLSSMTPTIALKDGRPAMALGGSGGPMIITGVVQVLLNMIDFRLDPARAVAEPRVHEQASPDIVFLDREMPESTQAALTKMGYRLKPLRRMSAIGAITIAPGRIRGAFDPHKGGGAAGY